MMQKKLWVVNAILFLALYGCAGTPTNTTTLTVPFRKSSLTIEKSWKGDSPIRVAMLKQFATRPKVAIAVVGSAETMFTAENVAKGGMDIEQWRKGMIDRGVTELEQEFLEKYSGMSNFALVDRTTLDKVMNELSLSASGISNDSRVEIGKLTGATHLLLVRYTLATNAETTVTNRLIDVQSGEVLATASYTYFTTP